MLPLSILSPCFAIDCNFQVVIDLDRPDERSLGMMPEDSIMAPTIRNDENNYLWYNWQPFCLPQLDIFMPSSVGAASLATAAHSPNSKGVNSSIANGWLLPYPTAPSPGASSPHHDAIAATSTQTYFLPNALGGF